MWAVVTLWLEMFRPFHLRDWGRLSRLSINSVPLNASLILTYPTSPVRGAIGHRLLRRNFPTFIWRDASSGPSAFAQLHMSKDRTQANVLWVGSSLDGGRVRKSAETWTHQAVWQALFDELAIYLGQRGVQHLIIEAREDSAEAGILREIGFANYSRQDVYKLEQAQPTSSSVAKLLTPRRRSDDWDIEKLHAHTVPHMIRIIEPHPSIHPDSWIYHENNELVAFANHRTGHSADWLQLMVRLEADADPTDIINDAIIFKPPAKGRPLYCSLRHYQSWLRTPLEKNGFRQIDSQVVMVRHTTQAVKTKVVSSLESVLQAQGATVKTVPYVRKSKRFKNEHRHAVAHPDHGQS